MGDRERWDARHAMQADRAQAPPEPFVVEALDGLGAGAGRRALDLAAGSGRHALELARRGFRVEAWDVSPVALERLARSAAAAGLAVTTRGVDLSVDLAGDVSGAPVELVVLVNFLDRGLLARLHRLVVPGGHALVSTFTVDRAGDHPRAEWCLARGELARGLPGFVTIRAVEGGGRASLLARAAQAAGW